MSLVLFRVVFEVQNDLEMFFYKVRMKFGQILFGLFLYFEISCCLVYYIVGNDFINKRYQKVDNILY